ncbi:putative endonuclease [Ammoniphilus resinae]|uniref:Endonuclease n=2 Tax=Ammoniphilus resinae TaxID=861532 RepID=A0ABS4GKK0_9BACL|nr:putative endonuclease [Ammoniphilus resinae]
MKRYEIDLIVMKEDTIVFVEVKTRTKEEFAKGYESVNHAKQARIRKAATLYLMQSRLPLLEVRFDVISVGYNSMGESPANILHFKNAF